MKKAIALFLAVLILGSFSLADDAVPGRGVCLSCGSSAGGSDFCVTCGAPPDSWICYDCQTKNLSDACMKCGKTMEASLTAQAEDPRPLTAWPAVCWLAASGDPASLLKLGTYYDRGIMVAKDADQALGLFRKAGEAGYAPAWLYLGKLYDGGIMVSADAAAAMECYQKAADLGSAEACWYVGSFYEDGTGVEQNYSLAADYYQMAAERGDADSWMSIAYFYLRGHGKRG